MAKFLEISFGRVLQMYWDCSSFFGYVNCTNYYTLDKFGMTSLKFQRLHVITMVCQKKIGLD